MFTIDFAHSDPAELNTNRSEFPDEHKSSNLIKLDNGQICIQPNNRILWKDSSIVPK